MQIFRQMKLILSIINYLYENFSFQNNYDEKKKKYRWERGQQKQKNYNKII